MARKKRTSAEELPQVEKEVLDPFLAELRLADDEGRRTDFIRKHITTGDPVVIKGDIYFELRRRVSTEFGLHPSAVVIVGSCKLGFSLKPKGPHQGPKRRYSVVSNASDVDVAVVSGAFFDEIWDAVFQTIHPKRDWPLDIGKTFTRDLFNGWIDPTVLPNTPKFQRAINWSQFFAGLSRERICGTRTINGRLYRSWDRLEAYQDHMVRDCRIEHLRGAHE